MKNNWILFIVILFCWLPLQSQEIKKDIVRMLDESHVPGISLVILENGRIESEIYAGVRCMDTQNPVNEETVFEAASLSKPVFAYIVFQLIEEGVLELDKPLFNYYEYEDISHDERYQKITARMVLSHTSGLPNWRRGQLKFQYDPGERFRYSGEGFVYLQKTVEHLTGKSLEELARVRVFLPLGMHRTSYIWQSAFDNNHAVPHDETGTTRLKNKPEKPNAAYSLQTTAMDYAKFLEAMIAGTTLQRNTLNNIIKIETRVYSFQQRDQYYENVYWGLGFGLQKTNSGLEYWHWGDNGPFKAYFTVNPDSGKGFVYFANSSYGLSITPEIARLTIDSNQPAWDWNGYDHYTLPAKHLMHNIVENGFEMGIKPFLAPNGNHQDTALIDKNDMNNLGYQLMNANLYDAAKKVFWMNLMAYPGSSNVHDSFAEVCMKTGDYENAVKYYRMAYEMDPDNLHANETVQSLTEPSEGNTQFKLGFYQNARTVTLAGDFNDWNQWKNFFRRENGQWVCRINLEPGTYHYKFVVDGVWILDPSNPESSHNEGRHQSILKVE